MNLLLLAVLASALQPAREHVVLQTSAGGLVVAVDPGAAPRAVAQFEGLVRAGAYDGMRIYLVDPEFLIQTSVAEDRDGQLTDAQRALLQPIPLEKNALRHVRGRLSMAHPVGDANGAVSSFSIMLGTAEHLDGQYTVFGEIVDGMDVLDELASVPVSDAHRPLIHLEIRTAQVMPSLAEARQVRWPRRSLFSAAVAVSKEGIRKEIAAIIATMLFCTLGIVAVGRQVHGRWYRAVRMLVLLMGGFALVIALLPLGQRVPLVGGLLFLGLIAFFKLMNAFEAPPAPLGSKDA